MKKFYTKLIVFVVVLLVLFLGFEYLSVSEDYRMFIAKITRSEEYITENTGADEIKPYIAKVQEKNEYTKLIIGDSVCHQMYNGLQEYNEDVCIVGSNAAITLAGQYILAEQFLENHENATDIYLILIPTAFRQSFDTTYGYQYTVMPFVETDTLQLLDTNTIEQMESVYGRLFMNKNIVWLIDRSAVNRKIYLNELQKWAKVEDEGVVSNASVQYIDKLKKLCDEKGVNLHLYPGPFADTEKMHDFVENRFAEEYADTIIYQYYPDYVNQIRYYPEEQFGDGIHFGGAWANQEAYNEKIKEMYEGTELLEDLQFE